MQYTSYAISGVNGNPRTDWNVSSTNTILHRYDAKENGDLDQARAGKYQIFPQYTRYLRISNYGIAPRADCMTSLYLALPKQKKP